MGHLSYINTTFDVKEIAIRSYFGHSSRSVRDRANESRSVLVSFNDLVQSGAELTNISVLDIGNN